MSARGGSRSIDCDAGDSLAEAVWNARSGDVLLVRGVCREPIHIPRWIRQLVIDGGGHASIIVPTSTAAPSGPKDFAVFIEGVGVTLRGFSITGGIHGIHLSGPASAAIVGNRIRGSRVAIHADKCSAIEIAGNSVVKSTECAIRIMEGSYARIGFTAPTRGIDGNVIAETGGNAVEIDRVSGAWIAGNTVRANAGHGIVVDRGSQAEIVDNRIEKNGGDGIRVSRNGSVSLTAAGAESPTLRSGNHTAPSRLNEGFGLRLDTGGSAWGELGRLLGRSGGRCAADASE